MAKLKDVAALAGVSVSTASAVINGKEIGIRVGAATRARIMDAVRTTGYVANAAARGLRTGRSNLIGVFPGNLLSSYVAEALQGLENVLMRHGYSMIICSSRNPVEFHDKLVFLQEKNVDGMIILPLDREPEIQQMYRLAAEMKPTVFMAGNVSPSGTLFVRADGEEIARLGTQYLIDLGHRRIALLLGSCCERLNGYRRALTAAEIPFQKELVLDDGNSFDDGMARFPQLWQARPTAVLAQGDIVAAGIIAGAHRHGVKIPEQLSVVGVDDMPLARMITPALTTVAQPRVEQGEIAADLLLRRLAGTAAVESIWLKPEIVERQSCRQI